ncbi:phosphatase PAP2 family protein [Pelagibacteraceae bacterium]|nr:phosphatase PAP2 family protein [Pelagibacteraceae bacterium]
MIKKTQVEIAILIFVVVNIFLSYKADIIIYNYFSNLNYGLQAPNLKKFFVSITELGDSLWYFLIIISVFLLSFVSKKTKLISVKKWLYLKTLTYFSFFYLVLVGLITQILKHIVGRPRPNYVDFDIGSSFNFFSTDASFHSFPSGHSSTIFAVALILSLIIPGLRVFFLLFAFIVALSRVVVGAHFTTDIVAGGLVAMILYKVFLMFLEKRYPYISVQNFKIKNNSLLLKTNIVFLVIGVFLTVGYNFDIFLSSLFYYGDAQFFLQNQQLLSVIFREILLPFLVLYIFVLPVIGKVVPIHKIYFGYKFYFKEIFFIWIVGATTLILVVNVLLKNMWGRTRPNEILQFGGNDIFIPWYKFGDSCVSNCSFVSGDASVGFALIVFYFLTKKNIYIYLSILFGISLGYIRIIAGGHFFSDIIFSQIVVTSVIFFLFIFYKKFFNE